MKPVKKNLFILSLLGIVFICFFQTTYIVKANDTDEAGIYSGVSVPAEATTYAKQIAPELIANIIGKEFIYDIDVDSYNDLLLGEPYTVYSFEEIDKIFYYPIIEKNEIKMIMSVYKHNNE